MPASYTRLLLSFPRELTAILKLRDADSRILFTDTATIVRWNKFFRDPDYEYEDSYGEMRKFPSNHIVIGANGGGDFYHLNSRSKRSGVLFWCHEDGEITKQSKDLAAFVRDVFAMAADWALYNLDLS